MIVSIRRRLLAWLLGGVAVAVAAGAASIYGLARGEADALFDYQLRQTALTLRDHALASGSIRVERDAGEGDVLIQVWGRDGMLLYLSHPRAGLPRPEELGFADLAGRDGKWRVFSIRLADHVVQVAQPYSVRNRLAADVALRTVWPVVAALPVLGLFIWFTVGIGLKPIVRLAGEVRDRSSSALDPLAEAGLPLEVQPLARALNDLLGRLAQSRDVQRAFVADAAHELRTPLTALSLQVQLAERASDDAARAAALHQLRQGVERATRLAQQLLALARTEDAASAASGRETLRLDELAREVVGEQAALAQAKRVDLGLARDEPLAIEAPRALVHSLLQNLVENAVKYTPAGGRVDVAVAHESGKARIEVSDTGPGIPAADRERVFDRFYRRDPSDADGSGLGLAIVRRSVEALGGTIALADAAPQGLRVILRLPGARPA